MPFSPELHEEYDALHADGLAANAAGRFTEGAAYFEQAHELAREHDEQRKRLDALNPWAKSLWSTGQYFEATGRLKKATEIAHQHDWIDEVAIADSNLGRMIAVRTLRERTFAEVPAMLQEKAVPHFARAYGRLRSHGHLYYRFANAQHGVGIAALAGSQTMARVLLRDGLRVAHRRSPEPYDQERTYMLNPKGLAQMAMGATVIPLGARTPNAEALAYKLIR